jgi:AAA domain
MMDVTRALCPYCKDFPQHPDMQDGWCGNCDPSTGYPVANANGNRGPEKPSKAPTKSTEGDGPEEISSWRPVDLEAVADGSATTEPPTMLARTDGAPLLYAGKRHLLAGEPESGKGWLTMLAAAVELQARSRVLYLDFEDSPEVALERLQALGVILPDILEHFIYVRPDSPLDIDLGMLGLDAVLGIVDGVTECMSLLGLNPYDNPDVATFYAQVARPLTEAGAGVLLIDHVVKSKDDRGRWALGAQHKMAGADVCFSLETIRPFGRGLTGGLSRLTLTKDRPGFLRGLAVGRTRLGDVRMDAEGDSVRVRIDPAQDTGEGGFAPTVLMDRVSRFLELHGEQTFNGICSDVKGKRSGLRDAVDALAAEGFLTHRDGPRNAELYASAKPYRQAE